MKLADPNLKLAKRRLLFRDSIVFLILLSVVAVLFGITSFLFRSFEGRRDVLAKAWASRGQAELQQGDPGDAVTSLRAALSYAPDDDSDQLLLAQALAGAGRMDEAINYFLNLWSVHPGDGFVNLQLARLMRRKGDAPQAIEYYRASIFGNWQGDGSVRRREVRLELADYLIERHQLPAAHTELQIAAGNAPDSAVLDLSLGDKFLSDGDLASALAYYRKAIADGPHNAIALEKGGRVAYALHDYATAHTLLTEALRQNKTAAGSAAAQQIASLADTSERLLQLTLSRSLPTAQRIDHLLFASGIARARLNTCSAQLMAAPASGSAAPQNSAAHPRAAPSNAAALPAAVQALQVLKARWKAAARVATRRALYRDSDNRDALAQLIDDTELQTRQLCGQPTGDDAFLLLLAGSPQQPLRQPGHGGPQ